MTRRRVLAALLSVLAVAWPGFVHADESDLVVSVAVSLKEPLFAAIEDFAQGKRLPTIDMHTGGSSVLAQQILRGAPTDVFLSASPLEIERLANAKLVDRTCPLGGNSLVVVVAVGGQRLDALQHLLDPRFARIGVANPRTAPLGRYTQQALEAASVLADLKDRRIPAEHARQVVDYVARGEVDAAVIYATDADRFADRVSIALEIDPDLHRPIMYQAALLEDASPGPWGQRLFEFLCSEAGRARFVESGLTPWPGPR